MADIINNVLATESGRIAGDILEKTLHRSPVLTLTKEGNWPEGMGESLQVLTWSRTLPVDSSTLKAKRPTWEDVTFSNDDPDGFGGSTGTGTGGSCLPPVSELPLGFSLKEYALQQTALESPNLCVNDLRNAYKRRETLTAIKNVLADATMWTLVQRIRALFTSICEAQVLIHTTGDGFSGDDGTASMPSGAGKTAGIMGNGALLRMYDRLIGRGAGNSSPMKADGSPVFPLVTSRNQSQFLKTEANYRDDFRWDQNRVPDLLKALGTMSSPLLGFQHIIDSRPDRWEYDGGWVWVPPYKLVTDSGSNKKVLVENPDYETATWEDSYLYHPDVFELLFPGSIADAGGGAEFKPVNYRGEWSWLNIPHRTDNPKQTIGFFRGDFMMGGKPKFPNYGYVIRHARCDVQPFYSLCS